MIDPKCQKSEKFRKKLLYIWKTIIIFMNFKKTPELEICCILKGNFLMKFSLVYAFGTK